MLYMFDVIWRSTWCSIWCYIYIYEIGYVLMYKNVRQSVALENEVGPASPFCSNPTQLLSLWALKNTRIPQLMGGFPCWSWLAEPDVLFFMSPFVRRILKRRMRNGVDLSILIGLWVFPCLCNSVFSCEFFSKILVGEAWLFRVKKWWTDPSRLQEIHSKEESLKLG